MKKTERRDFPGGTVDRNLPASAGDTGTIPDLGRFHMPRGNQARAPQLLRPRSRACELQLLKPLSRELCSATEETTVMRSPCTATKSNPHSSQLEKSPRAATKTQHSCK